MRKIAHVVFVENSKELGILIHLLKEDDRLKRKSDSSLMLENFNRFKGSTFTLYHSREDFGFYDIFAEAGKREDGITLFDFIKL